MKYLVLLCLLASAYGSVLRPVFPDNDGPILRPVFPDDPPFLRPVFPDDAPILRPVFPEEDEHPGSGIIALPAEVAPLVQIIVNIQKKGESAPVIDAPHFGPPAVEEVPDVPVVAPEFQPDVPVVPLVPIVPNERPPVGLFPIIPDLNRPGIPNTGMLRPQGPTEEIAVSPW